VFYEDADAALDLMARAKSAREFDGAIGIRSFGFDRRRAFHMHPNEETRRRGADSAESPP
jgi:hypothetical protein